MRRAAPMKSTAMMSQTMDAMQRPDGATPGGKVFDAKGYGKLGERDGRRRKSMERYWDRQIAPRRDRQRAKMPRNQALTKVEVSLGCHSRQG